MPGPSVTNAATIIVIVTTTAAAAVTMSLFEKLLYLSIPDYWDQLYLLKAVLYYII